MKWEYVPLSKINVVVESYVPLSISIKSENIYVVREAKGTIVAWHKT